MNPEHLLIAALVAILLVYGPNKLPQLGSALGKTVKNMRDGMEGAADEEAVEPEIEDADDEKQDAGNKAA